MVQVDRHGGLCRVDKKSLESLGKESRILGLLFHMGLWGVDGILRAINGFVCGWCQRVALWHLSAR